MYKISPAQHHLSALNECQLHLYHNLTEIKFRVILYLGNINPSNERPRVWSNL